MNASTKQLGTKDEIDLRGLVAHISRYRWWILLCVCTITAAFGTYAFLARPTYRVSAVLMAASTDQSMGHLGLSTKLLGGLAGGLGIGGPMNPKLEEALAVLQSRQFTENFIVDDNLLPELYPHMWNAEDRRWRVPQNKQPTLAQAYEYFDRKIRTITDHKQTGLITLQINWVNPTVAANWISQLVSRLNQQMRKRAIQKADDSLRFLNAQLRDTSTVEVRNALGYLVELELKKRMVAQVTPSYCLQFVAPPVGSDGPKPVWPNKPLLLILGPLAGFFFGLMVTLVWRNAFQDAD